MNDTEKTCKSCCGNCGTECDTASNDDTSLDDIKTMLSLLDGVSVIVELYEPLSPAQLTWKQNWLDKWFKLESRYFNKGNTYDRN